MQNRKKKKIFTENNWKEVTLARFCLSKTELHAKYLVIVGTNHSLRFKKTTGLIFKTYTTVHIWHAPSLLFTIIVFWFQASYTYWREQFEWLRLQASFSSQFYLLLVNYFKERPLNIVQVAVLNIPPRRWCFSATSIKPFTYHSDMSAYRRVVRRSRARVLITSFLSQRVSLTIVPRKQVLRILCLTPTDFISDETGTEVRQ